MKGTHAAVGKNTRGVVVLTNKSSGSELSIFWFSTSLCPVTDDGVTSSVSTRY